jgi:hypothetical protein
MPLGIERIKRKTGFARPTYASDDYQLIARNAYIDIFQVMRSCPFDKDVICRSAGLGLRLGFCVHTRWFVKFVVCRRFLPLLLLGL